MDRIALVLCLLCGCSSAAAPADGGSDAASDAGSDAGADAGADAGPPPEPRADYGAMGPSAVANMHISIVDRTGARTLPVELWYPADESARAAASTGQSLASFEAGGANEDEMNALLAAAPSCTRATIHSALAAPVQAGSEQLPVVVFSHCHACARFDMAEVAERLASHGIVVAAPDHVTNTIWDQTAPIDGTFLAVRASDISSVLDRLIDPAATELPSDLRGRIDPARAAVMGHSYGGATTSAVVTSDDRFIAALTVAAPISVIGNIRIQDVHVPYLFLLAREDNSISEAGNVIIRQNFARLSEPAFLVEVDDAGHWSFSDIDGMTASFMAGCGMATRQTDSSQVFTYLDPPTAREIAADVAMGFFAIYLLGDPGGATALSRSSAPAHVSSHP